MSFCSPCSCSFYLYLYYIFFILLVLHFRLVLSFVSLSLPFLSVSPFSSCSPSLLPFLLPFLIPLDLLHPLPLPSLLLRLTPSHDYPRALPPRDSAVKCHHHYPVITFLAFFFRLVDTYVSDEWVYRQPPRPFPHSCLCCFPGCSRR